MTPEVILGSVAFGASVALLTVISMRPRKAKFMTEEEILQQLDRSWLGRSDRKWLERKLAEVRGSRPVEAPVMAKPRAEARSPRSGHSSSGSVELRKAENGHTYATCSIVPGKTFEALWDTGATNCFLSHEVARNHLGIRNPKRELTHDVNTVLGDGRKIACSTKKIDWLIEGIHAPDVSTSIMLNWDSQNIIGMALISKIRVMQDGGRWKIAPARS